MPRKKQTDKEKEEAKARKALERVESLQLNLASEKIDPFLSKIIALVYICLVDIRKLKKTSLLIEEYRVDTTFLYFFENKSRGLSGYVGRDKDNGNIVYLIQDKSRFEWARQEGFITDPSDTAQLQFVHEKIGVLRPMDGVGSFVDFIAGLPGYKFAGGYLTATVI